MKHISTLTSATLKQTAAHGGCGECQTSCQSACKTSCGVANQHARTAISNFCKPYAAFAGRHFFMVWR